MKRYPEAVRDGGIKIRREMMIADNPLATSIWTRVKTLGWRRASGK